jgi:hypothetical protein
MMGAILEPTADMGAWSVEVRRESAYLNGGEVHTHRTRAADVHDGNDLGFAVQVSDASHVAAALNQIVENPGYAGYAGPLMSDAWTIEIQDGWVRFNGPVICYGGPSEWGKGSVELLYANVAELQDKLNAFMVAELAGVRAALDEEN